MNDWLTLPSKTIPSIGTGHLYSHPGDTVDNAWQQSISLLAVFVLKQKTFLVRPVLDRLLAVFI